MTVSPPPRPADPRPRPRPRIVPVDAGLPRWLFSNHPVGLAVMGLSILLAAALLVDFPLHRLGERLDAPTQHLFRLVTSLGNSAWIILLAGALAVGFRLAARRAGHPRRSVLYRHAAAQAAFVLSGVVVSGLAVNVLKRLVGRGRPGPSADSVFAFQPLRFGSGWESFPSGHATTIFALAVALCCLFPRLRLAFLSVAVWVACSRVAIGVHWVSDVLAGAALGAATTLILRRWFAQRGWAFVWRGGAFRTRADRMTPQLLSDLRTLPSLARQAVAQAKVAIRGNRGGSA